MKRNGYWSVTVPYGSEDTPQLNERVNAALADVDRLQSSHVVAIQTLTMLAPRSTPSFVVAIHYTYDDDEATVPRGSLGSIKTKGRT